MLTTKREAVHSKKTTSREELVVVFQDFNGILMAKVSNLKDRETHAFGATREKAEKNALRNYRLKYQTLAVQP